MLAILSINSSLKLQYCRRGTVYCLLSLCLKKKLFISVKNKVFIWILLIFMVLASWCQNCKSISVLQNYGAEIGVIGDFPPKFQEGHITILTTSCGSHSCINILLFCLYLIWDMTLYALSMNPTIKWKHTTGCKKPTKCFTFQRICFVETINMLTTYWKII